ncbi:multidrug efflux RND transporter permease subunit [Taylorella equigenitalis]|uniref:Efflux pump membrane transporter n=3 Tax=Taylorella equigenitalis TaxID=29575 RepID=A0A654KIV6_TAYEM|nr:multidrug efflux RND transporter permease subunit [Taylorella equigenitalis]ADU92352.1 putative efflux system transmembrane protein [Taylorella equigenitalis MCE9]AFN35906.1 multidrug efflux system transmembrane protein [Taylorella equigenitalis ATCC 35865]ASY30542.1 multidrug efflux RND transporter permease subunit [Taylorella equigenitalis]ASY39317.1 multidrug efflux RND transporter permease subunit [Taylorella equigenitalis]ASY40835.1 multidrug efflux RND transporter permease subunit [Ta
MANFFIHRPIFAWVVAILISLFGYISLTNMPISQYPEVAPPSVTVSAIYPGASPQEQSDQVTSVIESQLSGVKNMIYYSSTTSTNGMASTTVTFEPGTDPALAQIDVQNVVSNITSQLPAAVIQQGLTFSRKNSNFLMIGSLYSPNNEFTPLELADYIENNIKNSLTSLKGVGQFQVFGANKSLRVWVNPNKLSSFNLTITDVVNAITSQNISISAGVLGSPPVPEEQTFTAVITANGQLQSVEDFKNVVLTARPDGSSVKLKDVANIEIGNSSYAFSAALNGKANVSFAISLAPGANAIETNGLVLEELKQLSSFFPEGIKYSIPYDSTPYVKSTLNKVFNTLIEAIVLVFIVMFLFLQNWRYTLIPAIVVPIALLGTITVLLALGYSINILSMFAMVLAIGILVDDAIVVVENVERIMATEKLPPKAATIKAMPQISGAIIGITLVLIVVFFPLIFMSGSAGIIYEQFAVTMAISIAFSGFLAITLSPALCATLLKPVTKDPHSKRGFFGWFNRSFEWVTGRYSKGVASLIRKSFFMMILYLGLVFGTFFTFSRLPTSFLPQEDQGYVVTNIVLPTGVSAKRTQDVIDQVGAYYMKNPLVENFIGIRGFSFNGTGLNAGLAFTTLKPFNQRLRPDQSAPAIAGAATGALMYGIPDAIVFSIVPPSIPSLGTAQGVEFQLQDRGNFGSSELYKTANELVKHLNESGIVVNPRISGIGPGPQLDLKINREKAATLGVPIASIANVIRVAMGSSMAGKFPLEGRLRNVWVQAEGDYRDSLDDILKLKVKNINGQLVDISNLVTTSWSNGPSQVKRFNGYEAINISATPAPGYANGDAMKAVEDTVSQKLPKGYGVEWSGLSYQEVQAGNQAPIMLGLAVLVIFLVLAALYESWTIPLAAILIVPMGIFGTVMITRFLGLANDIYFQVGLITVMGLSVKNAILIVEFAKDAVAEGKDLWEAAVDAAHLRFRPIVMTSLAFIMGVIPLTMATGEGAASQKAIGFSVLGGMLAATPFSVTFVPVFFVVVLKLFKPKAKISDSSKLRIEEEEKLTHLKQDIYETERELSGIEGE